MTIQLRINKETGKKDIVVSLKSDDDMLPHEHEQQHRNLVDKLIEGGMVKASDVGQLIVEREEEEGISNAPNSNSPQEERQSHSEGN